MNQPQEIKKNCCCVLVVWVTNSFNSGTIQWSPLKNVRVLESLSNGQACDFSRFFRHSGFWNFPEGQIQYLLFQSQQWKHQNNVSNKFKVNNKETRTMLMTSFWCLVIKVSGMSDAFRFQIFAFFYIIVFEVTHLWRPQKWPTNDSPHFHHLLSKKSRIRKKMKNSGFLRFGLSHAWMLFKFWILWKFSQVILC